MAFRLLLLIAANVCISFGQTKLPDYQLLRAEEDWGGLRDPASRTDWWIKLKYIPLGEDAWLSLGADVRERYEGYAAESFGTATPDGNGYLQHRLTGHADLHLGRWRVFGQWKSVLQQFRQGAPRANDIDRLDMHQAFVERGEQWRGKRISLRAGRQEIRLGSTRLSGIREGPNVRLNFDGLRLAVEHPDSWRVDLLVARPVETRREVFNDPPNHGQTWWGAYGSKRLPGKRGSLDLYYFGLARRTARFTQATAKEMRHSLGARWWRKPAPGTLDYDWEFVRQFGTFGGGPLSAWYAASETGFTMGAWHQPRAGLKANMASGDADPNDRRLGTFHALYPDTKDFREQIGPGPANSIILRPFSEVPVPIAGRVATVTTGLDFFWRASARDGIYSFGVNPLVSGLPSRARYIGAKPALVVQLPVNRFTSINFIYAYLSPGRVLRDVLPGQVPRYAAIVWFYRF